MSLVPRMSVKHDQAQVRSYTVTELNQQTPRVLDQINSTGVPALITKHGRFVALITPLAGVKVEALLLKELLGTAEGDQADVESGLSGEDFATELDFNLPPLPKRADD